MLVPSEVRELGRVTVMREEHRWKTLAPMEVSALDADVVNVTSDVQS